MQTARGLSTAEEALAFVREHGVVLASAKGPAPRLTEAIVGEPIRGSWWAHAQSHYIYAILQAVTNVTSAGLPAYQWQDHFDSSQLGGTRSPRRAVHTGADCLRTRRTHSIRTSRAYRVRLSPAGAPGSCSGSQKNQRTRGARNLRPWVSL